MIRVDDLAVRYGQVLAASDVALTAEDGTTLGLIGPNGSGKSSVLRSVLGAIRRAGGTVLIDGDDADGLHDTERAKRLASVAQEEPSGLPLTAWESVLLGRSIHVSGWSRYRPGDEAIAEEALELAGVLHLADRSVDDLSGGERQRVLIARALAQQASHVLLDEPTNHLDVRYQHEILTLVRSLPFTTIVVLHDLNLAARYCDDLVLLEAGRVVARGTPSEVLEPSIIERVYGIGVERTELDGLPQLLFTPLGARRA